jgi:hypothetical protein
MVPVDGGDLGIVPLREQFRAALIARNGVEGLTSRVEHGGIEDFGTAVRNFEHDRGPVVGAGYLDQFFTQGGKRGRRPDMVVCVWVSACRYLRLPASSHQGSCTERSWGKRGGGVEVRGVRAAKLDFCGEALGTARFFFVLDLLLSARVDRE